MGLPSLRNHEIRPFPRAQGPGAGSQGLAGASPWLGWLGPGPLGPGLFDPSSGCTGPWAGWALGYLILPQAVQALLGLPMGWAGLAGEALPGEASPRSTPHGSSPGPSHTTRARVMCARARARAPAE